MQNDATKRAHTDHGTKRLQSQRLAGHPDFFTRGPFPLSDAARPIDRLYDLHNGRVMIPRMLLLLTALVTTNILAQSPPPERVASAHALRSERDPAVTIQLPADVQYVGAHRWVLYGVADCEVHVFVEADAQKRVSRMYWIQFEGYLPQISASYDGYTSPLRVDLGGGREFIVDGGLSRSSAPTRQGSDRERVQELLKAKGYVLPAEMMTRRMVHLPTPDRRKELMIIYAEDLAPSGFVLADLTTGGKSAAEWPRLERELLRRARERITLR